MSLLFSFSLFLGLHPDHYWFYRDRTLIFIQQMRKAFPGAAFVAHLLSTVPQADAAAMVAAAEGDCTIKRYTFSAGARACRGTLLLWHRI